MKIKTFLILALVLLPLASGFSTEVTSFDGSAAPHSPAQLNFSIMNNGTEAARYSIDHSFSKSGWIYSESSILIEPGETEKTGVTVTPPKDALQQSYSLEVYITERSTGETQSLREIIDVERNSTLNIVSRKLPEGKYRPGSELEYSVTVQNLDSGILSDYSITASMENQEKSSSGRPLAPAATKKYSFSHTLPENEAPGPREVSLRVDGVQQRQYTGEITVEEIIKIDGERSGEQRLLGFQGNITVQNLGNAQRTVNRSVSLPSYLSPLLEFSEKPQRSENGSDTIYSWEKTLNPGERHSFTWTASYTLPVLTVTVLIILFTAIRKLSGNVKLEKETEDKEDGKTVSIQATNNTETIKDITISDFVPNVVELDEDFDMTEPEVKKTVDGTELEWKLEDVRPGETRMIQYAVEPKIDVEEGIELPEPELEDK